MTLKQQIEQALGRKRATRSNPFGAVVSREAGGWRIADDWQTELHATFAEALEAAETWGREH